VLSSGCSVGFLEQEPLIDGPAVAPPNRAEIPAETRYETVKVKTDSNLKSGVRVE